MDGIFDKLSYQRLEMSFIHNFISDKIKQEAETGKKYYLNKKEVKDLVGYIKSKDFDTKDNKEQLIEQLSNMEMLMVGKEQASFYFW